VAAVPDAADGEDGRPVAVGEGEVAAETPIRLPIIF
jgi:hypothetical protein